MSKPIQVDPRAGQKSALEAELVFQLQLAQEWVPDTYRREYRFDKVGKRRFRFDFAWPEYMIAAEVQGGQWIKGGGRHQRGSSLDKEYEKLNLAVSQGWRVFMFSTNMINDGSAVQTLIDFFENEGGINEAKK